MMPPDVIELTEWDTLGPEQEPRLKGRSLAGDMQARRRAESLRRWLDIRAGYEGLEITSTSFVGRVDVGPLRIAILPKLPALPLTQLLRYAYGLRDIAVIGETRSPSARDGLHELLIALLAAEVEELLHRGLTRRYVPLAESLASPRGRILIDQLIRQGGVREAKLPCKHFERRADWHLNRVLRAGLEGAARLTGDGDLRRHLRQLAAMFGEVGHLARFDIADIDRAERELTRLTAACEPALTLIRLLHDAQGLAFDSAQPPNRMPGFLFDMNRFFQRLLSRFLRDHLTDVHIADEWAIRHLFAYAPGANPRQRQAPAPRPDYALFRDATLTGFLDAKYRDVWQHGLPAEWLYQLSTYALAAPANVSVLLYASMSAGASDEKIDIRRPGQPLASVIVRPVPLALMAELLVPDRSGKRADARRQLADRLVTLAVGGEETPTAS